MEECQPFGRPTQDDQEGIDEFQDFGKVEDVGPEEERATWRGFEGKTKNVMKVRCVGESGECASQGHCEGESKEDKVMNH